MPPTTRAEVDALVAGGQTYFTAGLCRDGTLSIVPDIYHRDGSEGGSDLRN